MDSNLKAEEKEHKGPTLELDAVLELLGNSTRRAILSKLAKVPHSTSELHKALGISRQAVHSQLQILKEHNIIEKINPDKRGGKYRIKANLSISLNISPDYYNINYDMVEIEPKSQKMFLSEGDKSNKYNDKTPSEKIKFLGEQIRGIEEVLSKLDSQRKELLQRKESFIIQLKSLMKKKFKDKFSPKKTEMDNLELEIFYTLFFEISRFQHKINIDHLLDELFFTNLDSISRATHRTSIEELLRELSNTIDVLKRIDNEFYFMF
jgi:predicted transcriptional regulator